MIVRMGFPTNMRRAPPPESFRRNRVQCERCVRNRLVEAQGAEFLSVLFVFKRAGFYPFGARGAGFLSQFVSLVFFRGMKS